jgi:NADPH-dependent ferric siderophore reductase
MSQPQHARDMSTLVGTSKTLERAISGLQMNSKRLAKLLGDETATPGISALITALQALTKDDRAIVDDILSHRAKPKRKHK